MQHSIVISWVELREAFIKIQLVEVGLKYVFALPLATAAAKIKKETSDWPNFATELRHLLSTQNKIAVLEKTYKMIPTL